MDDNLQSGEIGTVKYPLEVLCSEVFEGWQFHTTSNHQGMLAASRGCKTITLVTPPAVIAKASGLAVHHKRAQCSELSCRR